MIPMTQSMPQDVAVALLLRDVLITLAISGLGWLGWWLYRGGRS
jgi:hypothetical protein